MKRKRAGKLRLDDVGKLLRDRLLRLWYARACFVCGKVGWCGHREIRADAAEARAAVMAELESEAKR